MKRTFHLKIFVIVIILFFYSLQAQTQQAIYYYGNLSTLQLDTDSTNLWVRSQGLLRINRDNDDQEFFNRQNSDVSSTIKTIACRDNGEVWFGADCYLCRFYNGNVDTIAGWYIPMVGSYEVNCISFDKNPTVWVGVDDRICKFQDTQLVESYLSFDYQELPPYPTVILPQNEKIWIGTLDGLSIMENESFTLLTKDNSGLPDNHIISMNIDKSGLKWIGTNNGLAVYNDTTWTIYNTSNSPLPSNKITSIYIDHYNNIWIGTPEGLVKRGDDWMVYNKDNSILKSNYINSVVVDEENRIWIATGGGWIEKYDAGIWTEYSSANSGLASNWVHCAAFDSSNIKLIGTAGGLSIFDGRNWLTYNKNNSPLPSNNINDIEITENGTIWLATGAYNDPYGGVVKISNGNQWKVYTRSNSGLPHNCIKCIEEDTDGSIWIGNGAGWGLIHYDGENWQIYNNQNSPLPFNTINNIEIDGQGVKWILTEYDNLVRFDGNSWNIYYPEPGDVGDIEIDSSDNCWVTVKQGVIKYELENHYFYSTPGYLKEISVDSQNNKWIGYFWAGFKGISRFNDTTWTTYLFENNPLPFTGYETFLETDNLDNKWIGNNGVIAFNENGVDTSFSPGIKKYELHIENIQPLAVAVTDTNQGRVPLVIRFNATSSYDPDGYITEYHWDFGDGFGSYNPDTIHTYESPGTYDVVLSVVDNKGAESQDFTSITVNAKPSFSYKLSQNFPNPFNTGTIIEYELPEKMKASIKVYDILGNLVTTLLNEEKQEGIYQIEFKGGGLSSGIYIYRLIAGQYSRSLKMILLK